jgi:hypothetical protein
MPTPRLQTLQRLGEEPESRYRYECGECGHALSVTSH